MLRVSLPSHPIPAIPIYTCNNSSILHCIYSCLPSQYVVVVWRCSMVCVCVWTRYSILTFLKIKRMEGRRKGGQGTDKNRRKDRREEEQEEEEKRKEEKDKDLDKEEVFACFAFWQA